MRIDGTTAIPKQFDQLPLRHGVLAVNNDTPDAKVLLAMFAFEDDAEAFIAAYNEGGPAAAAAAVLDQPAPSVEVEAFKNPLLAFVVPDVDGQPGEPSFSAAVSRETAVTWLRAAADQIETGS